VSPKKLPVAPTAVLAIAKELRASATSDKPLVLSGARELAAALRRELTRDGVESAVQDESALGNAAALLYVLTGPAGADDIAVLRRASLARTPIVAVLTGPGGDAVPDPPYVLAANVVRVPPGTGFPIEEIARRLAAALGEHATPLAARLPVLRDPVVDMLISRFSRQNAVLGTAVFMPGADMPVLTLNQVRLLLRIADTYGFELDRDRIPEVLGVIASGFGFRALARSALGVIPFAGWALRGGIAYGGTRALGEAARRYFEARAPITRVPGDRSVFPR
jgi:uncharacterized protein (DUF697 family)